jgi:hypothetical protein
MKVLVVVMFITLLCSIGATCGKSSQNCVTTNSKIEHLLLDVRRLKQLTEGISFHLTAVDELELPKQH